MVAISSGLTVLFKYVLPVLFFAGLGSALLASAEIAALVPMVVGLVIFGWFSTLADEVLDCGDTLLVKRWGKSRRIPLAGISAVDVSLLIAPAVVTLHLKDTQSKPHIVRFLPKSSGIFEPSGRGTGQDLAARVQNARKSAV